MINVTERAKQELKKLLSLKVDWPQARLRIVVNQRKWHTFQPNTLVY